MSRRPRVPAPFQKILPGIIRGAGPRLLVVAAGCAALLLVGGSSYLISRATPPPAPTAQQKAPLAADTPPTAKVLGADTSGGSAGSAPTPADSATPSDPPAVTHSGSRQHSIPNLVPCTTSCSATTPTAPVQAPSGDVTHDVAVPVQGVLDLTRQLLGGL